MKLVNDLRAQGVKADLDHAARSMKAQFKYANKLGVKNVVVIADDELKLNAVKLRNMTESTEETVPMDQIVERFTRG